MMRQLWKILLEEHRVLWKRPVPPVLFFLTPIVFCLVFGLLYQENTLRHIPLAICDLDQSVLSRSLIQVYADSERFDVLFYPSTQEEMEELLRNGRAKAGLEIPKDFSKRIKLSQDTEIAILVNSANNFFGNSAMSAVQENNRTFSLGVAQKLLQGMGILPKNAAEAVYPIHIGARILRNPTTGYTPFMLSGIMLHGLQMALLVTVAPLLAALCAQGMNGGEDHPAWMLLVGKAIPYWCAGLAAYAISLFVLVHLWAIPLRGELWQLLLLGGCFLFAVIGVLYLVSSISPDEIMAVQGPLLYIMPGLLFSGLSWPLFSMEGFARWYAGTMPITYTADSLRDLMLAGYAPAFWENLSTLLLMGTVAGIFALGAFSFRRHRKRATKEMSL